MIKFYIYMLMTLSNVQKNTKIIIDRDSKLLEYTSFVGDSSQIFWSSSLTDFLEQFPLLYDKFIFSDLEDNIGNITVVSRGNTKESLPLVYLLVLNECGLKFTSSFKPNKTLLVKSIADDILTPPNMKKGGGSEVSEKNIIYNNTNLRFILKSVSNSNHDINFVLADGLSLDQRIDVTIDKYVDSSIKKVKKSLNRLGIFVEIVDNHPYYIVKNEE